MDHLRCVVERMTYQNEENGFSVLKCRAKNYQDLVTVVGHMPDVHVGAVLTLEGEWRVDGRYGRQFAAGKWEETLPATTYGIEKYLGSGLIKGIGPNFAKRIVQKFGKDTLEIIETDPDSLIQVEGIGQKRVECIKKGWQEQKEIRNIMLFLQSNDVSTVHAARIYKTYGNDSVKTVQENPYRLADDIWGIGFKTADQIAGKLGFEKDCFMRLRSGILYSLNRLSESGHCYAVRDQLIDTAVKLLEVEAPGLERTLDEMLKTSDVLREEEAIYLPPFYFSETGAAKRLSRLLLAQRNAKIAVDQVMARVKRTSRIAYDEVQLQAIQQALCSKVMVLTGGPGTGKTTATLGIIQAYRMAGCRILLAAPTGRAAKRMSEATGMEAKTIHRLLEYQPAGGYQRNEENPLEADVLILDECSMIDIMLMYSLLKALPDTMTLILVGDTDQLPSVGAGNVLKDIIASGAVPVVRLTRIFRQAQGSQITMNAHRINRGEMPELHSGRNSDFFFAEIRREDGTAAASPEKVSQSAADLLVKYCTQNLPRYFHADAFRDIQVLTPMQRGICGAVNLNELLQQAMNPSGVFLKRGGTQYRLRDKVMQIKNDYDKEVFNGDIGIVARVDTEERELTVDFDGRKVVYDAAELDELVLAYATTIHKAQGSEYPIVVMPLTMSHSVMVQRKLLYTGVTRAKKVLVLIGEKKAVTYAVRNDKTAARNTKLAERLRALAPAAAEMNSAGPGSENPISQQPSSSREHLISEAPVLHSESAEKAGPCAAYKYNSLFDRLAQSKFRSSFSLHDEEKKYVNEKGMKTIRSHAQDFVKNRLAPAHPRNDGRQTPMRGHPVFIAQHATATCCRGCLEKWYRIPQGCELTEKQQNDIVNILMAWIERQMKAAE